MINKKTLQIGNILIVIATIIVNALANLLPINGKLTAELSDNIPNLFVPAGITFSIWGVIYLLLIAFIIYQGRDLFKKEKKEMKFLQDIGYFFILANLMNIIWIFLWHYEQIIISLVPMIILFCSLLYMYLNLKIGIKEAPKNEKIFVHVPISVYLGWITVATIANATAVLVTINWNGFNISPEIWTILVLIIATIITLGVIIKRKDIAYSLVIIWALLGIMIKRLSPDPIFGIQTTIASTAGILIIVILIALAYINLDRLLMRKQVKT
jgi:hypothetical protein